MSFTISTLTSLLKADSLSRVSIDSAAQGVGSLTLTLQTTVLVDVASSELVDFGSMTTANVVWIRTTAPVTVTLNGADTGVLLDTDGVFLLLGVEVTSVTLANAGVSQANVLIRLFGV